ncbi:hypothetical protein CAPTEDRAFT_227909 [Capitella teleta]|uniref:Endonuclease/exonuclease/phosphatase domain-containing protein n=1 Tax=Capitella teleta TaxID=283909 RepID=R7UCV6_CAPTE|nr:hypothetical protein CAPTEDRAFT_227909 [Capitella teleta]|eukprot:ELU01628.1 hypothetical protein CAPTEDRAFT_227909 [Capitella teleta]
MLERQMQRLLESHERLSAAPDLNATGPCVGPCNAPLLPTAPPMSPPKPVPPGRDTQEELKEPEGACEYFDFRVDPELSVETVKQHITDGGATVMEIERMSQNKAVTQSFRVLVNVDDPNKLYNEDFWGDGVGCRRFYSQTWLINETAGLIAVDTDYLHVHNSGMDSRQEVIMGRPKGGTAILYRSDFGKKGSHVDVPSPRACAVVLTENSLCTMLICVYMPCDNYSTSVVDPEFDDVLHCIDTIMYANPCHEYVVCGDFNVSFTRNNVHSRRLEEFLQRHGLSKCWDSPISNMSNTYQNFSLNQFSCIDHICLSNRVFSSIESCEVISDPTNPSNHSALAVKVCQQGVLKLTKEGQAARVNACLDSGLECIPAKKPGGGGEVAGWNEFVRPAKDRSLFWHWIWCECGRPNTGALYETMKRSRHQYHYAVRLARKNEFATKKNSLAEKIKNADEMARMIVIFSENSAREDPRLVFCTAEDIRLVLRKPKSGKVCRLFNLMISHGYVPHSLLQATVISIPKDTRASLCKSDNYRGIALCNSIDKLFDLMILGKFESCFYPSDMQFGFKRGMSTTLCTATLRETMHYFSQRGSDAFVFLTQHYIITMFSFSKILENIPVHIPEKNTELSEMIVDEYYQPNFRPQNAVIQWTPRRSDSCFHSSSTQIQERTVQQPHVTSRPPVTSRPQTTRCLYMTRPAVYPQSQMPRPKKRIVPTTDIVYYQYDIMPNRSDDSDCCSMDTLENAAYALAIVVGMAIIIGEILYLIISM